MLQYQCPVRLMLCSKCTVYTVRNIIPAVLGLRKVHPNIGRENLHKIPLYENKIHLGVHISLLVQKRMIFCLFWSVFPRIGTMP